MTDTAPKPFVFVLMPFGEEFNDVYQLGIKPACLEAGAYCERVDEQIFQESILDRIYNQVSKADFLVADMTGRNPNVFYETGYSHALGKRVILLTRNADDIPFDLKHYPHIVYGNSIATLKEELHRRLHWFIENPSQAGAILGSELEFYIFGQTISDISELPAWKSGEPSAFEIDFQIHNPSTQIIYGDRIKLAIIASLNLWPQPQEISPIRLPDGQYMRPLPSVGDIFPDSWVYLPFTIRRKFSPRLTEGDVLTLILRVFTEIGTKDISFRLKLEGYKPPGE